MTETVSTPALRVLICTHHFHEWAGSELVVIELFEDLRRRGMTVRIYAPFLNPNFAYQALGDWGSVIATPDKVDVAEFDLVLVFHQAASRFLHLQDPDALFGEQRPIFAYFHLSPFEPFEAPGLVAQRLLGDLTFANSLETKDDLTQLGAKNVALFENPAPSEFSLGANPNDRLKRLLSVSSHLPPEMLSAFDLLNERGVEIYRIGKGADFRRVRPYDLADHDAVVTIGKTVQYGLRAGRPVFCYDHFQGPGWLNQEQEFSSFSASTKVNFSGRDYQVKRTPEDLADAIETGYARARLQALRMSKALPDCFKLETQVDHLIAETLRLKAKRTPLQVDRATARIDLLTESRVYDLVDRAYEEAKGIPALRAACSPAAQVNTYPIKSQILRTPSPGSPMVIAAFSFRHDAHLVDGLLENIGAAIHGYVAWDDREADPLDLFSDETTRQSALFNAAQSLGADWIFAVDPDERFEDGLADKIGPMTKEFGPVLWTFECREMFSSDSYRTDGLWGLRQRIRLYPCLPGMEPDQQRFHGSWTGNGLGLRQRQSGLNFYHLRMATPLRRKLRRDLYATLDADRRNQALGYDYLDDERGQVLETIPSDRSFSPPHIEDGGIWASPDLQLNTGPLAPDPLRSQVKRLQAIWLKGGYENAMHVALDILKDFPKDPDITLWAADCAARAGLWDRALELAQPIREQDPEALMARVIVCRAQRELGQITQARKCLAEIEALAKGGLLFQSLAENLPERRLLRRSPPSTLWQRWIDGPATMIEGRQIAECDTSVVVLSLGAPTEVTDAVESLLQQSVVPEITVVNSGGGDIKTLMAPYQDRIRLITTQTRLYAGAARNVGIDVSKGRYISFLASDCTVCDDNIRTRQTLHRRGARAVSAFVEPETPENHHQTLAALLLHSSRSPNSVVFQDQHYSLSLDRKVFDDFGYFPTGLRIGEDTYLKNSLTGQVEIVSDPGIRIRHRYPNSDKALREDIAKRARRRVRGLFFPYFDTSQTLKQVINGAFEGRRDAVEKALILRKDEFDPSALPRLRENLIDLLHLERQESLKEGEKIVQARQLQKQALTILHKDKPQADALILEALEQFSEAPGLYRTLADIRSGTRTVPEVTHSIAALTKAARIDPGNANILLRLMDFQLATGKDMDASRALERACLMAPRRKDIWARHAPLPGDLHRPMRVYCLQRMFFLDPFDRSTSQTIAENYRHAGNETGYKARVEFTQALFET
ncbi:tetratricopeptide repeat protein [Tropicibacter sp. R15_0]|uniref:glycosyltransferase n=1 Tax=Tropicibacter sp. R15_0 TaxID=2821101 RepID=UPI001ADC75D6|nr:glycosyltransferase [Tropicibacter sp. R15_0]MBO9467753.1 tetratricopeptide repeat protein [Tropicibacter sp. R15_0]